MYRGQPFIISGEVAATGDPAGRDIQVLLDRRPLVTTRVSGRFSLEITPPEDTRFGKLNLAVLVPPEGRYAGSSENRRIGVTAMSVRVQVRTPAVILLPGAIPVSGMVFDDSGPVANAPVSIKPFISRSPW